MKNIGRKLSLVTIGSFVMALGIAVSIMGTQGADPFGLFWAGITKTFGISLSQANLYSNGLLLLAVLFIDRKQINVGTVLNPFLLGIAIDLSLRFVTTPSSFPLQLTQSIVGVLILGVGVGIYTAADFGKGPFDGLIFSIAKKYKISFPLVRRIGDATVLILGFAMGAKPGIATVVAVFVLGKVIHLSHEHFSKFI